MGAISMVHLLMVRWRVHALTAKQLHSIYCPANGAAEVVGWNFLGGAFEVDCSRPNTRGFIFITINFVAFMLSSCGNFGPNKTLVKMGTAIVTNKSKIQIIAWWSI
jgi:hypothetical protein